MKNMYVRMFVTRETSEPMERARRLGAELERDHYQVEYLDTDSAKGSEVAAVYDVVRTPTILVLRDNGSVVQGWYGDVPRQAGDIRYYLTLH